MAKKTIKIIINILILSITILLLTGFNKNEVKEYNIGDYYKENNNFFKTNIKLLNRLKDYAKDGMINRYNFKIGDLIENVYNLWGEDDERNYVEELKGMYSIYNKQEVTFVFNKGSQIFEIRSYDKQLKNINLSEIKEVYKEPEYNIINSQNQRVVGYKVNGEYKIEFVLTNPNGKDNEQFVDYYLLLCPKLTRNIMADDPGREW